MLEPHVISPMNHLDAVGVGADEIVGARVAVGLGVTHDGMSQHKNASLQHHDMPCQLLLLPPS